MWNSDPRWLDITAFPSEWGDRVPNSVFKSAPVRSVLADGEHGIKAIGDGAFEGCTSLKTLVLPPSLRLVDDCAFSECRGLQAVVLPPSVTSLGRNVFQNCSWLVDVTLPPALDTIHKFTFYNCKSIEKIVLPPTITSIGSFAFSGCSRLQRLDIPPGVKVIGEKAFSDCLELIGTPLPASLTSIADDVYNGCTKWRAATVVDDAYFRLDWEFVGQSAFKNRTDVVKVVVPSRVRAIGRSAFRGCSALAELTLPRALTLIGARAFQGCSSLVDLVLPPSVHTVDERDPCANGSGSFSGCTSLQTLVLPQALMTISFNTFARSLSKLKVLVVPTTMAESVAKMFATALANADVGQKWASPIRELKWNCTACTFKNTKRATCEMCQTPQPTGCIKLVQLVSAPDIVVASLGGAFSHVAAMSDVGRARTVTSQFEYKHWTVKSHSHRICTAPQRQCARTLLHVGARLYLQSAPRVDASAPTEDASAPNEGSGSSVCASHAPSARELPPTPRLPSLPDELWLLILGWLRRSDLGASE
jgi:hypothetical protein